MAATYSDDHITGGGTEGRAPDPARRRRWAMPALAAVLAGGALAGGAMAEDVDPGAMRAAVEKYRDVAVALAEGYIADPSGHCITAGMEGLPAEWGGMGIHYLRPDLLALAPPAERVDGSGTHTDFLAPAILLYEPRPDGGMELVGVENLVFEAAWLAAGHDGPPVLNGRAWDRMADDPATPGDEAHGFMPHFDQHVWLFRDNPAGMLTPFNANVTCDHHKPSH